jgi:hypothetical protein
LSGKPEEEAAAKCWRKKQKGDEYEVRKGGKAPQQTPPGKVTGSQHGTDRKEQQHRRRRSAFKRFPSLSGYYYFFLFG